MKENINLLPLEASMYCEWYGKDKESLTECEQEQCWEERENCTGCPFLIDRSKENGKIL